ncbi:hypothetical protein MMC07_003774 [Pseudocyphellaria aurata]|nr:hypothetical protein [Pseudocyphellaria aurata]
MATPTAPRKDTPPPDPLPATLPATGSPPPLLASIMLQIELVRLQNEVLLQELQACRMDVTDLIRIRAELIARSETFEKDVQRRLDELTEIFHRENPDRQA